MNQAPVPPEMARRPCRPDRSYKTVLALGSLADELYDEFQSAIRWFDVYLHNLSTGWRDWHNVKVCSDASKGNYGCQAARMHCATETPSFKRASAWHLLRRSPKSRRHTRVAMGRATGS